MKTNCVANCSSDDEGGGQPFPGNGPLKGNMNLSLECLKKKLAKETGQLYIYILTTVQKNNGRLIQTGSAPNFQGGYITLCSCKHYMRTLRTPKDWGGVWVAGFTNQNAGNALFYLMKIEAAYDSQYDIWNSNLLSSAREAKNASKSKFGDIFKPRNIVDNPCHSHKYDPSFFEQPCVTHVHNSPINGLTEWHADIDSDIKAKINKTTKGKYIRKAALLVGKPDLSFLWQNPQMKPQGNVSCSNCKNLASGHRVCDIKSFLSCLIEKENLYGAGGHDV